MASMFTSLLPMAMQLLLVHKWWDTARKKHSGAVHFPITIVN